MSTDDLPPIILDLIKPENTFVLHKMWPHVVQKKLGTTNVNGVEKNWTVHSVKLLFLVPDSTDINYNKIYKAWVGSDGAVYLVVPLIPDMLIKNIGCMTLDTKNKYEKFPDDVATSEASTRVGELENETVTLRLVPKNPSIKFNNKFFNHGMDGNNLRIHKHMGEHKLVSKTTTRIVGTQHTCWGYVNVAITGTEVECTEQAQTQNTENEDDAFASLFS